MPTLGSRTLSIIRNADQFAGNRLAEQGEIMPTWAKKLLSNMEEISSALHLKKEPEEDKEVIKAKISEIPPVTLGSAVMILQKSALFDNGYSENHQCDLCPHPEVSRTLGRELKAFLNGFPLVLDKYA